MTKKKIKIGIDVDGVLRDFDTKVMEVIKEVYPDKITSEETYGWDFPNVDVDIKELAKLWQETHCEEIFREAPLMPNVKEEFKALKEWGRTQRPGFQYAVVTAQMPYNANHTLYWLGKHYFNFLENIDVVQYLKQPNTDTRRPHAKNIKIEWLGESMNMFWYDGCAFTGSGYYDTIAKYTNDDPMAIIQKNIGLIGCHPESQEFWYDSYSWLKGKYHNGEHHKLLLEFVDKLTNRK